MDDPTIAGDEHVAAAYWAIRNLPPTPEVLAASKGSADLWARVKSKPDRTFTRDERRLADRYKAVGAAHDAQVIEAYRSR